MRLFFVCGAAFLCAVRLQACGSLRHLRHIESSKQRWCERDIGRNVAANKRVIFRLVGNQPQLSQGGQGTGGSGDGEYSGIRLRRQSALNGQCGDGALDAIGQRVIVKTQPPAAAHLWPGDAVPVACAT